MQYCTCVFPLSLKQFFHISPSNGLWLSSIIVPYIVAMKNISYSRLSYAAIFSLPNVSEHIIQIFVWHFPPLVPPVCNLVHYCPSDGTDASLICNCSKASPKVNLYSFYNSQKLLIGTQRSSSKSVQVETNKKEMFYCSGCNGVSHNQIVGHEFNCKQGKFISLSVNTSCISYTFTERFGDELKVHKMEWYCCEINFVNVNLKSALVLGTCPFHPTFKIQENYP